MNFFRTPITRRRLVARFFNAVRRGTDLRNCPSTVHPLEDEAQEYRPPLVIAIKIDLLPRCDINICRSAANPFEVELQGLRRSEHVPGHIEVIVRVERIL